jgi:hypothetical protein
MSTLDSIRWQNNVLAQELQTITSDYSTDAARVRFIQTSLSFYYSLNFYLFLVYIVLGLIAMYVIFFKTQNWTPAFRFSCLFLIALYPFLIGPVEYALLFLFTYMYSLFVGNVHVDPYYQHQNFSISNILSFSSFV